MEEKKLSYEKMEEMLENELKEVDARKFWKTLLIEQIINNDETEYNLTESELDNAVENLMNNDVMWQEIDNALAEELENCRK